MKLTKNMKTAIRNFCDENGIECKRIDDKKLELAYNKNCFSAIFYYQVRKGIKLYMDWDTTRDFDNEMLEVRL